MTLPTVELAPLDRFTPQRVNANAHTPRGHAALETSVQADGWIGAQTAAADGEIFDGSDRQDVSVATGFDAAIVVHSDGSRPVIVVRDDIPTATDPRARRLGLAANRVAELNLAWDPAVLGALTAPDLAGLWTADELAALLPGSPDFAPVGIEEQGRLDERTPVTCPECGHRFVPKA